MAILGESDRKEIRKILGELPNPVKLVNFTQTFECESCRDTHAVLEELAEISDKLSLEVWNFAVDKEKVAEYGVDKIPATVVEGSRKARIRIYGPPEGYEFASLLDTIKLVSEADSALEPGSRSRLATLDKPIHLEVLVTPT